MKALVLAAGVGSRMRHLTHLRPKPMLPVGERPLLEQIIEQLQQVGIREIGVNLHHLPDVIVNHFADGSALDVQLTYLYEPRLLGTAGAARGLASLLDETFVVMYGDVFTNVDLARLIAFHRQPRRHPAAVTIALYHAPNPSECGLVALDENDRVVRFVEKPPAHEVFTDLANSGILICEPTVLNEIPVDRPYDFGHDLLPRLLQLGWPMYGTVIEPQEFVIDIGTPNGYARAEQVARTLMAPENALHL